MHDKRVIHNIDPLIPYSRADLAQLISQICRRVLIVFSCNWKCPLKRNKSQLSAETRTLNVLFEIYEASSWSKWSTARAKHLFKIKGDACAN